MALNRVDLGIQYFPQFAADRAIANAQIYIGQPNLDPAVLANQIQAYVVQENGTQVAVPQPIRTGAGGVPTYNGSPVQVAVDALDYSIKVLTSTGSQIYYVPSVAAQAAFFTNASAVVYDPAGTGAVATTVENKLLETVSVEDFGAVGDGVADDTPAFLLAAASGFKNINAKGKTYLLTGTINIQDGQVWNLDGSTINFASSTLPLFNADTVDDWALQGKFTIIGDGSAAGTAKAIAITDCRRWLVDAPTIRNVRGWGIYLSPGSSTTARSDHGTVNNPRIQACYIGWEDIAGTGAEYCTVVNAHVTECSLVGIKTAAGNIVWLGGHCVDNVLDGMIVGNGSNHAHGMVVGMNINHNNQFNLVTQNVVNGQDFIGCHFYGNGGGTGAIFFDESKGICIRGGEIDCIVYNYTGVGSSYNYISDVYCPGSYGDVLVLDDLNIYPEQLIIQNCTGPGAYISGVSINTAGILYVQASRQAGSTQALVSGIATTLIFNTVQTNGDRQRAYDETTGIFTVPTDMDGQYRISLNVVFSGTAINAPASYCELRVNGSAELRIVPLSIFGTAILSGTMTTDVYLSAGQTISVLAAITATDPFFGTASYSSALSIQRIA